MRVLQPLRSAPMALLWGGLSLSAVGDQLYTVALSWIAVGLLGPDAGYLAALQALVVLLAVLGIGRWADRWDQQRSMVGADVARAAILLAVIALWVAQGGPGIPQLIAAVVVLAVGQAIFQPALQTVLPTLIDDHRLLPAANGLLDATDRSARLIGPGLVAALAGIVPVMHFLTLDAASFLASAAALVRISQIRPRHTSAPRRIREGLWQSTRRGVRAMAAHRLLGFALRTTWLLNGCWYGVFFLALPLMIAQQRIGGLGGSGLGAYGMVISAYGCTNLAASLIFGGRTMPARPQWQMFGGGVLVGLGVVSMGLARFLPPPMMLPGIMAAAALGAIGGPMKDIPMAVLRQTRLARADTAAAMRAYMAVGNAGTLLAMLVIPLALQWAGVVAVIVGCGLALIAIGAAGLIRLANWIEPASHETDSGRHHA